MKLLHAMGSRPSIAAFLFALANTCVADPPMMVGISGGSGASASPPVRIVEPADGSTVNYNGGDMMVRVEQTPALAAGTTELLIDGRPVPAQRKGDQFVVSGIERGAHSLQARSTDINGDTAESGAVMFNVWQPSALFRHPNK